MGEFHLLHWIVVLGVLAGTALIWGYPLAVLCRRAGKPTAVAWIAATIGAFFCGPLWCVWWLALSAWKAPQPPRP
jgi:hypothetical protein